GGAGGTTGGTGGTAGAGGSAGAGAGGVAGSAGAGGASDPFAGRPLGQCVKDSDCPGNICNHAVPGGQCQGAGCPTGTINNGFGCVYECTTLDDCPPGLRCLSQGLCGIIPCSGGVCPISMFDCGEVDRCARVDCTSQNDCPSDTTCSGGHCI